MSPDPSDYSLEGTADRLMMLWGLSDPIPIARTVMALVLRVKQADGAPAVLKCLGEVGRKAEGNAPAVLEALGEGGAVRVLRADAEGHLLEYCAGPQLLHWPSGHGDKVAMPVIADVVRRMHGRRRKRPEGVPSLADRCRSLDEAIPLAGKQHGRLLRHARRIADDLLATQVPTLLHGDLHHENIMRADRSSGSTWLAIDPQGVWGDLAYEVANIFGNPRDHPAVTLAHGRARTVATELSERLCLDPSRLLGWAFVHSCISAAWSIKDGEDPSYRIAVAEMLVSEL